MPRISLPLVVVSLLIALAGTSGAGAQDAKPAPGCAGLAATDPEGDALRGSPLGPGGASPGNMDITGVFFTHEGGKTYAHMQLADASDAIPDGAVGARWYINFTSKGAARWVRAYHQFPNPTEFQYGHWEEESRVLDDVTEGQFHAGPDGVMRILVPGALTTGEGVVFTKVFADTAEAVPVNVDSPGSNKLYINDRAPDGEAFGKDFPVGPCSTGGGGGSGGGPTTPPPGGGGSGPSGSAGTPVAESAALPVKASSNGGSAKKVARRKKLVLDVEASTPVRDLVATLYQGDPAKPKRFGTGKLGSLTGKGKLTIKLTKKVKKGAYKLRIDGKLADGRSGIANSKVRFKK